MKRNKHYQWQKNIDSLSHEQNNIWAVLSNSWEQCWIVLTRNSNPQILSMKKMTSENVTESHGLFPYNPIIANVLFRTTFLESWGSGMHRIVAACLAQGQPSPVWSVDKGMITVTFQRPKYPLSNV